MTDKFGGSGFSSTELAAVGEAFIQLENGIKPDPNAGGKTHLLLTLHFVFYSRLFSHLLLRTSSYVYSISNHHEVLRCYPPHPRSCSPGRCPNRRCCPSRRARCRLEEGSYPVGSSHHPQEQRRREYTLIIYTLIS